MEYKETHTNQTSSEAKYNIDPDKDFDICNVASSTDLTGLIPFRVENHAENDSYGELYEYQSRDIVCPKEAFKGNDAKLKSKEIDTI